MSTVQTVSLPSADVIDAGAALVMRGRSLADSLAGFVRDFRGFDEAVSVLCRGGWPEVPGDNEFIDRHSQWLEDAHIDDLYDVAHRIAGLIKPFVTDEVDPAIDYASSSYVYGCERAP